MAKLHLRHKVKKFNPAKTKKGNIILWGSVFAILGGIVAIIMTSAATPGIPVTVDSSIPNPQNVRAYGDDRVATLTWDAPANASGSNIVGYYITWGTGGVYTTAKQTEYTVTQIQPLTNGTQYNVKVQSVQGSYTNFTIDTTDGAKSVREARANGKVSSGATVTVTASSARVDQLRTQMTGFFDDFNQPAGGFDELKWNTAASCNFIGEAAAFLNNQFHTHNQVRSGYGGLTRCGDRGQTASRARGVFDITGRTESNPGVVVFDFDGLQFGRDAWYMDLIPVSERKDGIPYDIQPHQGSDDDLGDPNMPNSEPKMIRMAQKGAGDGSGGILHFMYYGDDQRAHPIPSTGGCADEFVGFRKFSNCAGKPQVTGLSPLPEPDVFSGAIKFPRANVRAHWRWEVSPTKMKLFINNVLAWEGPMPAEFSSITKYTVYSSIFSYNTGKGQPEGNTTDMLHWDNFGFNGPAQTTVTHNYLEGGPNGNQPYLGFGTVANPSPRGNQVNVGPGNIFSFARTTKVNIPDPIGSPSKAKVLFTVNNGTYPWSSNDSITINGHKYPLPNPANIINGPVPRFGGDNGLVTPSSTFFVAVPINASDLRQGMNDLTLDPLVTCASCGLDLTNVHIEIDYPIGGAPTYTQPINVFTPAVFMAAVQPALRSHDAYLFIEQDMGLPSGALDTTTPPPPSQDTTPPNVSITSPANNTTVSSGSVTVAATATDNVGVKKVVFLLGGIQQGNDDTSAPYGLTISTTSLAPGTYPIQAVAYDTSDNSTASQVVNIIIPNPTPPPSPTDTTPPTVTFNFNGFSTQPLDNAVVTDKRTVSMTISSTDSSGIASTVATINGSPTTITNNSITTPNTNGNYTISVTVRDNANNTTVKTQTIRIRHRDFNRNGIVDLADLSMLMQKWNTASDQFDFDDTNTTKLVDLFDVSFLMQGWGSTN